MPLPKKSDLLNLNTSFKGVPFCHVEAKNGLDTSDLDYVLNGSPFYAVADGGAVNYSLNCTKGVYSLTGFDAQLVVNKNELTAITTGGIGKKAKQNIKKNERQDIEQIIDEQLKKLDFVEPVFVEQVKKDVKQQIKQIDFSIYENELIKVREMVHLIENRIKILDELKKQEEDDELSLLILM